MSIIINDNILIYVICYYKWPYINITYIIIRVQMITVLLSFWDKLYNYYYYFYILAKKTNRYNSSII